MKHVYNIHLVLTTKGDDLVNNLKNEWITHVLLTLSSLTEKKFKKRNFFDPHSFALITII